MLICTNHREETAVYAAEELKKYLDLMHPGLVSRIAYTENARATEGAIVLILLSISPCAFLSFPG